MYSFNYTWLVRKVKEVKIKRYKVEKLEEFENSIWAGSIWAGLGIGAMLGLIINLFLVWGGSPRGMYWQIDDLRKEVVALRDKPEEFYDKYVTHGQLEICFDTLLPRTACPQTDLSGYTTREEFKELKTNFDNRPKWYGK